MSVQQGIVAVGAALAVFSIVIMAIWGNVTVPAGAVYVQYDKFNHGVLDEELGEGFHLIKPWIQMTEINVREQVYLMSSEVDDGSKAGYDPLSARTSEGLNVDIDVAVRYKVNPDSASELYQDIGPNYESLLVRQTIEASLREIAAKHTAIQIYGEQREAVQTEMFEHIEAKLAENGITVVEVQLKKVSLPSSISDAIEEKLQAQQQAQKMEYEKQRAELEAQRRFIEATGIANATIEEARGQAEAIRIVNDQLSGTYNQYVYYQALFNANNKTVVIPADTNMILNGVTA